MEEITLRMTENEAHVFIRALDIVVSSMNREPYDGILNEIKLTSGEQAALHKKIQEQKDILMHQIGCSLDPLKGSISPIKWPPTDKDLIEYLSRALEYLIKQSLYEDPAPSLTKG